MDLKKNIIMLFTLSLVLLNITSCKVEQNKTASEEGPYPDGLNIKQYINTIDGWSTPEVIAESPTSSGKAGQMASPHLLKLADGRILLTYFRRDNLATIRYKIISSDGSISGEYNISATSYGFDPTATQLSNGRVIIAYADYEYYYRNDVVIKKIGSNDLINWTSLETIARASSGSAFVPSIAAVNNDLFLVYAAGTEGSSQGGVGSAALYFNKGTYNSGSWAWEDPKEIYSISPYSSKPSLIKSKTGDLLVAFYVRASNGYDDSIYLGKSADNGTTWQPASLIYDTVNTSEKWPFLMELEMGNLWCAFTTNEDTGRDGDSSIKLLRLDVDDGTTWVKDSIYSRTGGSYTWPALVQIGDSVMAVWDNDGWNNTAYNDTIQKSIAKVTAPPPPPCDPRPCVANSCLACCGLNGQCGG